MKQTSYMNIFKILTLHPIDMSVFFIGCPHIGHRNINKYRPFVSSTQQNTRLIHEEWTSRVNKKDIVYVMGDVAFDQNSLDIIGALPGRKILIKGNHDDYLSTNAHAAVFEEIHGIIKYKKLWLSHCPIHPDEIRKCKGVVHAHVHQNSIMRRNWYGRRVLDKRYLNVCVDNLYQTTGKCMIDLETVKSYFNI